ALAGHLAAQVLEASRKRKARRRTDSSVGAAARQGDGQSVGARQQSYEAAAQSALAAGEERQFHHHREQGGRRCRSAAGIPAEGIMRTATKSPKAEPGFIKRRNRISGQFSARLI